MESKNLASLDLIQILDRVYPVGTPYFNKLDSRNPNIILGFGTWVAQTGFLVGLADSGTFNTLAATGGAETVTLTAAQSGLVGHNHTQNYHNHTRLMWNGAWTSLNSGATAGYKLAWSSTCANDVDNWSGQSTLATNNPVAAAAASQAHSNLPPYTVYAWWVRTA